MVREAPLIGEDDTMVRDERIFAGAPGAPPEAALELVTAYVRSAPLALAARLRTVRHRLTVAAGDDGRLAEVVDDEVSVLDGRRVAGRFREVEVELAPEADDAVLGSPHHPPRGRRGLPQRPGAAEVRPRVVAALARAARRSWRARRARRARCAT